MSATNSPKYSHEKIAQAIRESHGLISLAARRLGCSDNTIYKRVKRSAELRELVDQARAEMIDLAEAKLRQAVLDGQPWAIALTLRTIGKVRGYTERQEITGVNGEAMRVVVTWDDKNDNTDD